MAANDHSHIRLGAVPESEGHDYAALAVALKDTSTWFREPPPLQRQRARDEAIIDAAYRLYIRGEVNIDGTYDYPYDAIIANAEQEQT